MDFNKEELDLIYSALIEKSNALYALKDNMKAKGRWKANWPDKTQQQISELLSKIYFLQNNL